MNQNFFFTADGHVHIHWKCQSTEARRPNINKALNLHEIIGTSSDKHLQLNSSANGYMDNVQKYTNNNIMAYVKHIMHY